MRTLVVILALGLTARLSVAQSAPPEFKLDIRWCADAGGRGREAPAFAWGHMAVALLRWQGALAADATCRVEWVAPNGTVAFHEDVALPKGTQSPTMMPLGLRLSSAPHGTWTVRVRWGGASAEPTAKQKFDVRPGAADPTKPTLRGSLFQGLNRGAPVAKTKRFTTGHQALLCRLEAKAPPPTGHTITLKLYRKLASGKLELRAETAAKSDGRSNLWNWPVRIAGATWWSMKDWTGDSTAGPVYAIRALWNDDPTPMFELEFELAVGARRALLAVIADYPPVGPQPRGSPVTDLPGNVYNITNMRRVLLGGFGFQEKNITILKNGEATREAIERELASAAAALGPDDAFLFYFSGHGLQVPDLNGDEPDGWDEALVTAGIYPARMTTKEQLSRVLVDDRIAELLGRLKTKNVTVIVDSCHSGTAARDVLPEGSEDVGFPQEQRVRIEFGEELMTAVTTGAKKVADERPQPLDLDSAYVFISACQPWEVSLSSALGGGYLTSNLASVLLDPRGRTWDAIVGDVRNRVIRQNKFQTPTIEGARHRYPFTLAERDAQVPYTRPSMGVAGAIPRATSPQSGRSLARETSGVAGRHLALVSGLPSSDVEYRGVLFDVHNLGDGAGLGLPVGRVRITGKSAVSHQEVLVQGQPRSTLQLKLPTAEIVSGSVEAGCRLIPRAVRIPDPLPTVSLRGNFKALSPSELQRMKTLANALAKNRQITYRAQGHISLFDYIIVLSKAPGTGQLSLQVFLPSSKLIATFAAGPRDSHVPVIDFIATRHANHARLVRLSNPSPEFRLEVSEANGIVHVKQGAKLRLRLRATGKDTGKCYVTLVSGDGRNGLFPAGPSFNIEVPYNTDKVVDVQIHKDFRGRLTLKCFASTKRLTGSGIESFGKLAGARLAGAVTDSLRSAHGTEGLGREFISTSGWADSTLWFWVGR